MAYNKKFHTSSAKSADPATTTIVATAATANTLSGLGVLWVISMGLCLNLLCIWLVPYPEVIGTVVSVSAPDLESLPPLGMQNPEWCTAGLGVMRLYLMFVTELHTILDTNLVLLNTDALQQALLNLQGVIHLHEYAFGNMITYMDIWDPAMDFDPFHDELGSISDEWRTLGNQLISLYREIEDLLEIPVESSRIPTLDFEL